MRLQDDPLYVLLDSIVQQGRKIRSDQLNQLMMYLITCSDQKAARLAEILLAVVPAAQGSKITWPLQRLGALWAFGLVKTVRFNTDLQNPDGIRQRSMRLADYLEAILTREKMYGHVEMLNVLRDRVAAWEIAIQACLDLLKAQQRPVVRGALVERLLIAEAFMGDLFNHFLRRLSQQFRSFERNRFRQQVLQTLGEAMDNPWEPVLRDEDRALELDMIAGDALAECKPWEFSGLMAKIVSRELIMFDDNPPAQFVKGLTENQFIPEAEERLIHHLR